MKNNIKLLFVSLLALPLVSCSGSKKETVTKYVNNGGFETSDLSGWTIEYGDAYTNDSVSSRDYFVFANDNKHNEISVNKTGNWYLSGQGFDLSYSHGRIGALRSNNFYLTEDGSVSMKLAGGALTKGKGVDAEYKNVQKVCFVGIYLAENDQMIARQTNEYFLEGTEDFIDANKYKNGVYHTDNFCEYSLDLSAYANKEVYMRIVDNDEDVYYGYLSVDDIRIGDVLPQEEGQYYVKTHGYIEDVDAIDKYHIKNPGFEIGSLGGWNIVEGEAFSHDGVNEETTWWNENITYNKDGRYHYGHYNPSGTGVLRSSVFELGGAGFVSFKLGGCADQTKTFIRFMAVNDGDPIEVTRVSNAQYKNEQFPFVPMKMHLLNMVQYYVDLNEFVGEKLYLEIVDNNTSTDDLGCMTFDSFETYYTDTPYWSDKEYYKIDTASSYEREPVNEYQPINGTFEKGDLTGWTTSWSIDDNRIGEVSSKSYWWDNVNLTFNKRGTYFFNGEGATEVNTGSLTSSPFIVGGVGFMTFRMSGGRDPLAIHVSIIDATTEEELLRFANYMFNDLGTELIGHGSHLMDMVSYKADLTSLMGREVKIRVVDNASSNWGLVCVDSFITYYETLDAIDSNALLCPNTLAYKEEVSSYQVLNGTFETGDFTGWTLSNTTNPILEMDWRYTWWNEVYLFNRQGSFFMGGWSHDPEKNLEVNTGTMTSSVFELGGSGFVTYRLGGGKNKELCHIEFVDADTDTVLATTYNQKFKAMSKQYYYLGYPKDLAEDGVYAANMAEYKVDLSAYIGKNIYIRLVDNATNDWGLLFVDDFVTYYENASDIPNNYTLAEKM